MDIKKTFRNEEVTLKLPNILQDDKTLSVVYGRSSTTPRYLNMPQYV